MTYIVSGVALNSTHSLTHFSIIVMQAAVQGSINKSSDTVQFTDCNCYNIVKIVIVQHNQLQLIKHKLKHNRKRKKTVL